MSVGCDGVRVCGGELCSRYHVYKNLWDAIVGEELPCEWYAVAVMRRSAIVGHVPRKISAACSLFLADQLVARYFWLISCLLTISGRSETVAQASVQDPTHIMS